MRSTRKSTAASTIAQLPVSPGENVLGKRKRADSDSDSDSAYTARTSFSTDLDEPCVRGTRSWKRRQLEATSKSTTVTHFHNSAKSSFLSNQQSDQCGPSSRPSQSVGKHEPPPRLSSQVRKIFRSTALKQPSWLTPDGEYPGFENFDKPEEQLGIDKCPKGCDCSTNACPCRRNGTTCELGCRCSDNCSRRFPACQCKGTCGPNCVCNYHGRDCGKACRCTTCGNIAAADKPPKFRVQPSAIQGAGEGLYAAEFIKAGTFLGCYEGNIVTNSTEKTPLVIMDFEISKDLCVRPDRDTCLLFKVNHWRQRANIQFVLKETLLGRKVYAFAKRDILPGHEMYADYRTNPEFDVPIVEPRFPVHNVEFTVSAQKNNCSYVIEPLDAWQRLEQVYTLKISGDQFLVGDDVFINYSASPPSPLPDTAKTHQVLKQRMRHCWVGRILEIRIQPENPAKRHAVIAWYDKPWVAEPKSRKIHSSTYGKFELVGTHNIEVQDCDTISGRADVEYVHPRAAAREKKLFYRSVWDESRGMLTDPTGDEEVFFNVDPFKLKANKQKPH